MTVKYEKRQESEMIDRILSFEDQALSECRAKLSAYRDMADKLKVEITTEFIREHGLYRAMARPYDLRSKGKLPRQYSSEIVCCVRRDGKLIVKQQDYDKWIRSLFAMTFPLVQVSGRDVLFFDRPFDTMEVQAGELFAGVSRHFNM